MCSHVVFVGGGACKQMSVEKQWGNDSAKVIKSWLALTQIFLFFIKSYLEPEGP